MIQYRSSSERVPSECRVGLVERRVAAAGVIVRGAEQISVVRGPEVGLSRHEPVAIFGERAGGD
jgi:hypothetical protein